MNKKVIALAALATVAGAASAQSSVTLYGRLDLVAAQRLNLPDNQEIRNSSGNRIGVRGVEDIGNGLKVFFALEHRFDGSTGQTNPNTPALTASGLGQPSNLFWEGKSLVGVSGAFGQVYLGRDDSIAYTMTTVAIDPFTNDGVAANGNITEGRVGLPRYSKQVYYKFSASGFTFGAQIGESNTTDANGNQLPLTTRAGNSAGKRPYIVGGAYQGGPIYIAATYENPGNVNDSWTAIGGNYDFGVAKIGGLYGFGRNAADQKVQSYLLTGTVPLGGGEIRATYGELKNKDTSLKLDKQYAIGYQYFLSKRSTVYATAVHSSADLTLNTLTGPDPKRTGYEIGLKHNF